MSGQIKVPDEDMIKEFQVEFDKAKTNEERLAVVGDYQHKIYKDYVQS